MLRKMRYSAAVVALFFIFTACANPTLESESTPIPSQDLAVNPKPRPLGPIKGTWIEVEVDSDSQQVLIPVDELVNNWNIHFKLQTNKDDIHFMAYVFEGELHVRANVCPPCRSIGYALDEREGLLICDMCATLFDAGTGEGIEGACVDYPKASVPYEIVDSNIVLKGDKLMAAYKETLTPG